MVSGAEQCGVFRKVSWFSTMWDRWAGRIVTSESRSREVDQVLDDEFSRYVKQNRSALRRRAFLLCGDWDEADDLVQSTLVKMYRRWHDLDRREELGAYTRRVMFRTFVSERRAHRWSRELVRDELPEPDPEPDGQARLGDRLLLLGALARLGPRQRAAIVLRYWEDLSVEETAWVLGCSAATVRSQASRALETLRSMLDGDSYFEAGEARPA
jgi:RNA polymerase sigma-70 factor (sigma-E family)